MPSLPTASTATVRNAALLLAASDILNLTPPARPSLSELLASAPVPWSLAKLAAQLQVDPVLFERVAARRQPLPRRLAARMAHASGLDVGSVEAAAGSIVDDDSASAYQPCPADRARGDALDFEPLARTVEVSPAP